MGSWDEPGVSVHAVSTSQTEFFSPPELCGLPHLVIVDLSRPQKLMGIAHPGSCDFRQIQYTCFVAQKADIASILTFKVHWMVSWGTSAEKWGVLPGHTDWHVVPVQFHKEPLCLGGLHTL